jgi:hypothetical protein
MPGAFELLRFREAQNFFFSPVLQVVALRLEPAIMTAYQVENPVRPRSVPDAGFAQVLQNCAARRQQRRGGARAA